VVVLNHRVPAVKQRVRHKVGGLDLAMRLEADQMTGLVLDDKVALSGVTSCSRSGRCARRLLDPSGVSFAVVGDPADPSATRTIRDAPF
jgi:hypothetical protein